MLIPRIHFVYKLVKTERWWTIIHSGQRVPLPDEFSRCHVSRACNVLCFNTKENR